ncbi:hypothetical protein HP555_02555 [Desulfobulbus oligotrophicus]|jgi:hypothetical protein|uniref:Double Cache domain-containing protein n=2 Tax=Desulfobulbus oligotrophicus TaxID=1909699 RepID=A0A7T6APL4_9BACT|nr:hypothetical protein HP555_02555 [Desulfobulbus oligotrophicus]
MSTMIRMLLVPAMCFLAVTANADDKAAIEKHVNEMVRAINQGKEAANYPADAYTPYVFIMEPSGKLIVHPFLVGEYLQEKAAPVHSALQRATTKGVWVEYFWKGTQKQTYVRKTNNNLIVGSGQ